MASRGKHWYNRLRGKKKGQAVETLKDTFMAIRPDSGNPKGYLYGHSAKQWKGGSWFMSIGQEVFTIKLYELEQQYGKLQSRIRVCGKNNRRRIREELQRAEEEYEEEHLLLQERVKNCRSRAVSRLAKAQLDYQKATDEYKRTAGRGPSWRKYYSRRRCAGGIGSLRGVCH